MALPVLLTDLVEPPPEKPALDDYLGLRRALQAERLHSRQLKRRLRAAVGVIAKLQGQLEKGQQEVR